MRLIVDVASSRLVLENDQGSYSVDLFSADAFAAISSLWLKVGWALKYSYGFTWLGRPIVQLPEDIIRVQELIYRVKPDAVVETGVAHGGSLMLYASILRCMGRGRVIGIDIDIRPENRAAIQAHELASMITLVEGSSTDPAVVENVHALLDPAETTLVVLDSSHSKTHVLAELEAYGPLVKSGSYIVATDGIMEQLHDVPSGRPEWKDDNPKSAAIAFAAAHPEFALEQPPLAFREGPELVPVTYWPTAFLRRR
jgi:cephalosporin hydroxylase